MQNFLLRNVCVCTSAQQNDLLQIRNKENVRRSMYTDRIITLEEHLRYVNTLRNDHSQLLYAVLSNDRSVVGALSFSQIDRLHKKCDWAFYLDEEVRGGVGSALEVFALNYVFEILEFEKLNCEILQTNRVVVDMHLKFGFVEEGFRRANIIKNGTRVGVHFLGITRGEWLAGRPGVLLRIADKLRNIRVGIDDDIN